MIKTKLLVIVLAIFFLADLSYSFFEYYYIPLDGDISAGVVPSGHVQKVLDDPFGFRLLATGEKHVNPNRFFAHFTFKEYMQKVPLWLQTITDPVTSVYLSCALAKFVIHFLVIFILATLISGTKNILNRNFLIVTTLLIPLIQANGYWGHMGIVDKSTTYTFFYALPVVLLMLFLMPFYRLILEDEVQKITVFKSVFVFIPAVILPLSGPLIPGLVLIISALSGIFFLHKFGQKQDFFSLNNLIRLLRKIPVQVYFFLVPISLISLYSLFLGRFDLNYGDESIPLAERYMKLPMGIYYQISQSLGVPLLLILIGIQVYLIKKQTNLEEGKAIVNNLKWIGFFSAVYLLLLPLGGYRPYRPNILRYDTFMPITIALLYFYAKSGFFLLRNLNLKIRNWYLLGLFAFFAIYMNADKIKTEEYRCERDALEFLVRSPDEITVLPTNCNVMSWDVFNQPERSEFNAEMLRYWGITKVKKLYYQSDGQK